MTLLCVVDGQRIAALIIRTYPAGGNVYQFVMRKLNGFVKRALRRMWSRAAAGNVNQIRFVHQSVEPDVERINGSASINSDAVLL